ncbi:peptide deformylase [Secundilactobacillus oryzae JCM 18671]|uniref:Peptide deformylase n=1 Tax=Secundilactobacillus oryzae JCM 18671 TaxID=1291743 RepID=A0A081BJQ2_9LACO|nr:peptide deformylase [Secundilactobacillus oryzae]GAK48270.1 peptide deformylase [Secundilactobacillus oryzae JCM 18671]
MIKQINENIATLSKKAEPATAADDQVVTDLQDTLRENSYRGVGLAANMINVNKAIIVVQMGPMEFPMLNPIITKKSGPYEAEEGCLSLRGKRSTTRYQSITVQYDDRNFKKHTDTFTGYVAQIIQHEVDHTNGILI